MSSAKQTDAGPKTVLITGASSGIGKATAEFFATRGWNVAASMRTPGKTTFSGEGSGRIKVYRLDVTDEVSIVEAVAAVVADFGRIDVLVNNAGYGLIGVFEAMTPEQIRRQFDTNVIGLMNVTRAVLPQMRAQQDGCIVNVASVAGRMTLPLYSLYCSSKWAVEGFTEALSYELGSQNIRVRIIEPGPIQTNFLTGSLDIADTAVASAYQAFEARVWEAMRAWFANAPPPDIVARSIYRAANSRSAWLRYKPNGWALMISRRLATTMTHVAITGHVLGAKEPILPWNRRRPDEPVLRHMTPDNPP